MSETGKDSEKVDRIGRLPRTDDERWRNLLGWMSVPKHPGVYVLGCFARHVTFYSQQVRALNLVDALCKTGALPEGGALGVVGAGLSGLTAAAAALRRGLSVHLFQKGEDPQIDPGRMPLQKTSDERWIDPFIYDWPLRRKTEGEVVKAVAGGGSAAEVFADLPVLNWKAETATRVRQQILNEFKNVVAAKEGRVRFHRLEVNEGHLLDGGGRLSLDEEGRLLIRAGADAPVAVNALVLAVGFGVEESPPTRRQYWTNDGLDSHQEGGRKSYLVSGGGDGGLTDVMRLCIADFKHRTVLDKFGQADQINDIGVRLEKAVRGGRDDLGDYFIEEARNVNISEEDRRNYFASRENDVYLTSSPEMLFGARSKASILNRLIVAWLFRQRRFKLVDARLRLPLAAGEGKRRVEFTPWDAEAVEPGPTVLAFEEGRPFAPSAEPLPDGFDEVIVRHGPGRLADASAHKIGPLEECFPRLWEAFADDSADPTHLDFWSRMPHWDDWTRHPLWRPHDFDDPPPLLDPRVSAGRTYVVFEHPGTKGFVRSTLAKVMARLHENDGPGADRPNLISLNLAEEFKSPHRFGRAVRLLCRADLVVFDLTEALDYPPPEGEKGAPRAAPARKAKCPEAFILLGIRSVARRGITILTARFNGHEPGAKAPDEPSKSEAPFSVPEPPFLLRDINFCGWGSQPEFITRLREGIEEGRARSRRLGLIYRDLPAYEEVRQLGPEPQDYRDQGPDQVVLFLSPLNKEYRREKGSWLKAQIGAERTGMYIVESASPEGTSLKLYAAIRRTKLCVVDWTERRQNVFFELGVRLASSPEPPVCVIHKGEWAEVAQGGESPGGVFDLFRPLLYDNEPGSFEEEELFVEEMRRRREALRQEDSAAAWPLNRATLSPRFVYDEVRAAVPVEAEDWDTPVWEELRTRADLILTSDPDMYQDSPLLFGDDEKFKRRADRSGIDRLLAAWYFLERRHGLGEQLKDQGPIKKDGSPWASWEQLGRRIVRELEYEEGDADYARMRDEIGLLLNAWRGRG